MMINQKTKNLLGINGSGRIGKLTLWHHLISWFDGAVLNVGRIVGKSLMTWFKPSPLTLLTAIRSLFVQ